MLALFTPLLFIIDLSLPMGSISVRRIGVGLSDYSNNNNQDLNPNMAQKTGTD
jgi:hypothetical protein